MDTAKPNLPAAASPTAIQPVEILGRSLPAAPSALSGTPDPLSMWKAFRRRWVLAVGLGVFLATLIGPVTWYLTPSAQYTAKSTLRIDSLPPRIMFDAKDSRADPGTYQRTQLALITGRYVLAHAVSKPHVNSLDLIRKASLKADPEEWLEKTLKASFLNGSEVLEVSLTGSDPEGVATIVNEVIKSYMTLVVEEERRERLKRLDDLETLWQKYQKDRATQKKKLKDVVAEVGTHNDGAIALAEKYKTAQLSDVRTEKMRNERELKHAQAEIAVLEAAQPLDPGHAAETVAAAAIPEGVIEQEVKQNPAVMDAEKAVSSLQAKYWDTDRVVKKKSDPALKRAYAQWDTARKSLEDLRSKVREDARQRLASGTTGGDKLASSDPGERVRSIARLRAQIDVATGYQKALLEDEERLEKELKSLNVGGIELVTESEELKIASDVAHQVKAAAEAVKVEMGAPERIRVLAEAKVPKTIDDEMKKIRVGGAAAFGSFLLAVLGVSFWEFRARRVDHADDVTNTLGLRLVGALPAIPVRARRGGTLATVAERRWQNLLIESIDATRTLLLHASRMESVRAVMVTSAVKGEGKTSLSCHLAASMARSGRKTLLIDGDLRSPSVHRTFDVSIGPGLSELLRGEVSLVDVVRDTIAPGLDLITAGQCDTRAIACLAREDLQLLLGELKAHYDFIIIDSAPLLLVTDSLLIAQSVDAALIAVLRDRSRLPEVHAAQMRLADLGIKTLGAVVNGVHDEGYGHSSYYSSYARPVPSEIPDA